MWKTKRFWVFLLAGFIGTAAFDELTGWSFFSDLFFSGLMFLIGASLIQKFARPENRKTYLIFCVITCLLFGLEEIGNLLEDLGGYVVVAWVGLIVINQFWKPKQLTVKQVQSKIKDLDRDIKLLQGYREGGDLNNYQQLAPKIIDKLRQVKEEIKQIKQQVKPTTYHRLRDRIAKEEQQIQSDLNLIQINSEELQHRQAQTRLEKLAPELLKTVTSIDRDSQTITQKIKNANSGNQAELLQLHQTQMVRYQTILEGYLKIKESPKDYYDAEQRLLAAKEAIEQFDLDLDEQLRQLNENDMHDFEVNLRLMTDATRKDKK